MTNTLGDLKTRIIAETNRDDLGAGLALETQLGLCIARAIEFHSDQDFWFNRGSGTRSTSNGVATVALPTGVRVPATVAYSASPLLKAAIEDIEYLTGSGLPTRWAQNGGNIQLWPIPDGAYALAIYGIAQIDAPTLDATSNVWTAEAQDLIAARTRFLLFRDVFRDGEGVQLAAQAEGEALERLRKESRRRGMTPLRSTGDEPWSAATTFNISTGN